MKTNYTTADGIITRWFDL